MRLVLYTNIPSHHQIPLGQAFADLLQGEFRLVCWRPVYQERRNLGWREDFEKDWLIKAWISEAETQKAMDLVQSADIVVWGVGPLSLINQRAALDKLSFRYTERPFKQGRWRLLDPRVLKDTWEECRYSGRKSYHLLSVGPHCASDFRFLGAFQDRMWRWGYFPELPRVARPKNQSRPSSILWAGRMVSWKRLDLLLAAAAWARAHGNGHFRLRIIGGGPDEERLRSMADTLSMADICSFEGPKSPEEVGNAMQETDIYTLTSDRNEGWGVVVNEAMSHGCCVIGRTCAGSVPWLIKDGVNGCTFESGNAEQLGKIILWCLENPERRQAMGIAARQTMENLWSPQVAAQRFVSLCERLEIGDSNSSFAEGPCSAVYGKEA